jgi:hypothetical protein
MHPDYLFLHIYLSGGTKNPVQTADVHKERNGCQIRLFKLSSTPGGTSEKIIRLAPRTQFLYKSPTFFCAQLKSQHLLRTPCTHLVLKNLKNNSAPFMILE